MQVSLRSACARTLALVRPPARAARRAGAAAPRAANGESTAGPLGGFVDLISKAVQNSPLAAGKQALAESQAAGYDPALAAAKVGAGTALRALSLRALEIRSPRSARPLSAGRRARRGERGRHVQLFRLPVL
jgi:hypothetical protein